MKAIVLQLSEEEAFPIWLKVGDATIEAMDLVSCSRKVSIGDQVDVDFTIGVEDECESVNDILSANPDGVIDFVQVDGWRYRAFGKIVSVVPLVVSCGKISLNEPFNISDPSLVGSYVAFNVPRLDACLSEKSDNRK